MKVIRLCLIIFALTAATLPAAPKKGGGLAHPKSALAGAAACEYWYYCYSNPSNIVPCCGSACDCRAECASACGGECDWDDTCIES